MANHKKQFIASYNKEKYQMYQFRVKKSDTDVINKLNSVESRNHYINNLIMEDIEPGILTLKQIKERIKPIVEKYHIPELYLFGSYARGEATRDSDVDIYCDDGDVKTLLDLAGLYDDFREALGKDVDIVTIGSDMHPLFKEEIDKDKIRLW